MIKGKKAQIPLLLLGPMLLVLVAALVVFRMWPKQEVQPLPDTPLETPASPRESPQPTLFPSAPLPTPSNIDSYDLTPEQKLRAEQLTSVFENGTIELQYGYVEDLDDGRGYTAGRAGFTTADGDAYEVVQLYTKLKPNNSLAKYLPVLQELAEEGNDSVRELKGYDKAWRDSADITEFRAAQDAVVDKLYYQPAKSHADRLGLKLPISRAFLYDTIIQHGNGKDPDGLPSLLNKVIYQGDEVDWLVAMIAVRKVDLQSPANSDTRDEWRKATGRCDVYRELLDSGNYYLEGPMEIKTKEYKVTIP